MRNSKQADYFKRIFLIQILSFILFIVPGSAQDETECPYFSIYSPDPTGVDFALVSTDVEATISGVIANVIIEQTYINSGDSVVDATYVFPMSTRAAVYAMEMIINGRTIEAVIKRKDEAQEIFDDANEAGHTASLLEQQRPNVFQMSLANIEAGDTLKVRMVYTELLVPEKGKYQFVFPTIVAPRYTTGDEDWIPQSIQDSVAVSQTALNINLKINAGMPLTADCKSHSVNFDYQGNTAACILNAFPERDFIVDYTLNGNEIETGLLLYEDGEENFFLSMIQPTKPEVNFISPQREYIFIMDVSGSMSGEPLEVSKELIFSLLNNLTYEDKFNIVFFAGGSSVYSPNSLPVTVENIQNAIAFIDDLNAGGGTNILPAMQRSLDMEGTEGYARSFIILTDGHVSVEKESFELIRNNLDEANFFSFGIGRSVNRYIIEGIAYVGEGEAFIATDEDDAFNVAEDFREYIEHPFLTNIEARFDGIEVYDIEPLKIPDLFAERPIIIYGKYRKPASGKINLTGDYGDGEIFEIQDFSDYSGNMEENIALKYLWARKRIRLMSDYGIASNESDTLSIEEEITRLGLKYSLVTKYTSFVAVDSNAVADTSVDPVNNGDDDPLVSTKEVAIDSDRIPVRFIKVMGTMVDTDNILNVKVLNHQLIGKEDLVLQFTDLRGNKLISEDISLNDLSQVLEIDLGPYPRGLYFVTLISGSEILDSDKFIIMP